jgi:ribosomal protein S18 acetylase RimI-like enzyme
MMVNISIDIAGEKERVDIISLVVNQFVEHSIEVEREELAQSIDAVFANDKLGIFLLARDGPQAVGLAYISFMWSLEHCGLSAWLDELYVIPAKRNRGIGRQLLSEVMRISGERGCKAVDLEVEHHLARAENLYRKEAFVKLTRNRWGRNLR